MMGFTKKQPRTYLFTGITSQLGRAFCRYIAANDPNSNIIGTTRNLYSNEAKFLSNTYKNLKLTLVNPENKSFVERLVFLYRPDVIGNLLAQSSVAQSFFSPHETYSTNTLCNINILESIRISNIETGYNPIYFNISSSEIYGGDTTGSCEKTENSPLSPTNFYALSKVSSHKTVDLYREVYKLNCVNFVCTNFISEFQNDKFVIAKILNYTTSLKSQKEKLQLGNIDSIRDWMYVDDVCRAIFLFILDHPNHGNNNYNISSYQEYSVLDILKKAFLIENVQDYENYINIDVSNFRLNDTKFCRINSNKIRSHLGWQPQHDIDSILDIIIKAKKCNKT